MKTVLRSLGTSLLLLAPSLAALAEEGGHGGGGHHEAHVEWFKWSMDAPPVGWLFVDFAIFLFIIAKLAGKPLSEFLATRHGAVKKAIEEAQAARALAEKKAAEFDARMKNLDAEVQAIRDDFNNSGKAVASRIVENAQKTADRILKDAQLTIEAEQVRAQGALKAETSRLALGLAEKMVKDRLAAGDHTRLANDFAQELRN